MLSYMVMGMWLGTRWLGAEVWQAVSGVSGTGAWFSRVKGVIWQPGCQIILQNVISGLFK